jgi:2-keto-4-pentenoate hydratase/2-oxohepta-3-ene-1,7-dioic acid hydratase in catechol pathway
VKYLTFTIPGSDGGPRPGVILGTQVVDLIEAAAWAHSNRGLPGLSLPASLGELLWAGPPAWDEILRLAAALDGQDLLALSSPTGRQVSWDMSRVQLHPPLTHLTSLRDFYAFEAHVLAAHHIRGKAVPPEWYQFPVFYFSNHNAIYGPGETVPRPSGTQEMDFELEVACVIGKGGRNILAEQAEQHIFGFTIFNDWSARDLQRLEMRVGLGPAKGKDFAASLGPWIVTPDELGDRRTGRPGVFDLKMTARLNGKQCSCGNWQQLRYSFGEMIARASQDVELLPGDVLGSGTVGSGCLLEITAGAGPYLQPGDLVELEIERLGVLANKVGPPVG